MLNITEQVTCYALDLLNSIFREGSEPEDYEKVKQIFEFMSNFVEEVYSEEFKGMESLELINLQRMNELADKLSNILSN